MWQHNLQERVIPCSIDNKIKFIFLTIAPGAPNDGFLLNTSWKHFLGDPEYF